MSSARPDRDFDGIRVSTVDWPIIVLEFPERSPPDAALRGALAYVESLMSDAARGREKIYVISDLTLVKVVTPASQRDYAKEWIKRTGALARAASVGSASVTPSAFLRGLLTALFLLQPAPTPNVFVATRRDAVLKGIQLLQSEGIPLPPRLAAYREANAIRRAG